MVKKKFAAVPQDTKYLIIVIYHFISRQKKDLLTMRELMYKFKASIFCFIVFKSVQKVLVLILFFIGQGMPVVRTSFENRRICIFWFEKTRTSTVSNVKLVI